MPLEPIRAAQRLTGGGFETWAAGVPDGWTVDSLAGGSLNQETSEQYAGASCLRIDKTGAGTIRIYQTIPVKLIPGTYFMLQVAAKRNSVNPGPSGYRAKFRNVTRGLYLNSTGSWQASSTTTWPSQTGAATAWRISRAWAKVRADFDSGDEYRFEIESASATNGVSIYVDACSCLASYGRVLHREGLPAASYIGQDRQQYKARLVSPSGETYDISDRITQGGLGSLTDGVEESLLQFTHSDMNLTLDDRDGFVIGLLGEAEPSDRWEMVVEYETFQRRYKQDRLFGGVLDLPFSLSHDATARTTRLTVFSYLKAAEQIDCASLGREVYDRRLTATGTAGTKTLTMNDTSLIQTGDVLTLFSGTDTEQRTVDRVDSATSLVLSEVLEKTWSTSTGVRLDTPWPRDVLATDLAVDLMQAAGLTRYDLQFGARLSDYPIVQPIRENGIKRSIYPVSVTVESGRITATFPAAGDTNRRRLPAGSITEDWSSHTASNQVQGDWTPYLTAEPATIKASASPSADAGGVYYWSYTGGTPYLMEIFIQIIVDPSDSSTIRIRRDGLNHGTHDTYADFQGYEVGQADHDTINDRHWLWYERQDFSKAATLGLWKSGVGNTDLTTAYTTKADCRMVAALSSMAVFNGTTLDLWDVTALSIRNRIPLDHDRAEILCWTLRYVKPDPTKAGFLAYQVRLADGVYLVWLSEADNWAKVGQTRVSALAWNSFTPKPVTTVQTLTNGHQVLVGFTSPNWWAASPWLDGVISYADLEGLSVAKALKETAQAALAFAGINRFGSPLMYQRPYLGNLSTVRTIEGASAFTIKPIWDSYRDAVKVTGETALGDTIEEVAGALGARAKVLEISGPFVQSAGIARFWADLYLAFFKRKAKQANLTCPVVGEPIRPLDVVEFNGERWGVTQAILSVEKAEQRLTLFSL